MSQFDPAALLKLDSLIAAARHTGDQTTLSDLLLRRADVRLKQGRQPEALKDLASAADAFKALQDWRGAGRAHTLRGRLLAGQAGSFKACNDAFNEAAALIRIVDDGAPYAETLEHKAAAAMSAGAADIAGADYLELEEVYGRLGDPGALARVKVARAALHHQRGLPHKALTRFDEAVVLARQAGDPQALLHVRLARRAYTAQTRRPDSVEPLHELLEEAQGLGLSGPAAVAQVARASELARLGKHAQAAATAEQARQSALDADDPVLYLFACLLLAECREALSDRPGVLAILLTCKSTLDDRLGKAGGRPLVMVLDSLETRWGAAALQEALRTYRKEARERLSDPGSN